MEALQPSVVVTAYGTGKILSYRATHDMYEIGLPFGILHATQESLVQNGKNPGIAMNAVYKALEKKRMENLESKCAALGIVCNHQGCTSCLLIAAGEATVPEQQQQPALLLPPNKEKVPAWVSKLRKRHANLVSARKRAGPALACRVCGNPTCRQHQSVAFQKQNIAICTCCETLFHVNFSRLVTGLLLGQQQKQQEPHQGEMPALLPLVHDKIQQMVETYHRVLPLLSHAMPFIPHLVQRLQSTEMRNNRVGVGTAGAGLLSGALGLAGTAAIFTPAGVPLLLASLALSGGSVAVTASHSAMNHWYETNPQAAADQILVMYSMLSCCMEAVHTLRSVLLEMEDSSLSLKKKDAKKTGGKDENNDVEGEEENNSQEEGNSQRSVDSIQVEKVVYSLRLLRQTGTGIANTAATSSTAVRSSGGAAASGLLNSGATILKVVPVLGAAFSGFCLAMDADRLKTTLDRIQAGDPSEKADALCRIQQGLPTFPLVADFASECNSYLDVIAKAACNQMPQ